LSTERIEKPSSLYKVGNQVEAEVINVDPRQKKIGLSIRALKMTEERQEMENYLKKERDAAKFSFETILNEELRLDRDEGAEPAPKEKSSTP
jgi:ribosomal protein S1